MKKLLIKVVCMLAVISMSFGLCVGCDDNAYGDITETMGVVLVTEATPDQATPDTATPDQPTVAPTVKPTETTKPTEAKPVETTAPTEEVVTYSYENDTPTWEDDDYDYTETESSYDYDEEEYEDDEDYEVPDTSSNALYTPSDFLNRGVINWGGWTWTYYSEKILPGEGLYLPGRHADSNGYICDGDGYICIASSSLPRYTVVDTPFGKQGKVYDCGCASHILDVYVNW